LIVQVVVLVEANFLGFPIFRSNKKQGPLPPATIRTPLTSKDLPKKPDDEKQSSDQKQETSHQSPGKEPSKPQAILKYPLSKYYGEDISDPYLSEVSSFPV
jgi:hypothetical protein